MEAQFRLLGPVEMTVGSKTVQLSATKPSIVLATLLLHANEAVPTDRLYETVWGDTPPVSARTTLQTYVLRLRQLFACHQLTPGPIRTVPSGYVLDGAAETVDLLRFRHLCALAGKCAKDNDLEEESRYLAEALSLWHGPALTNIHSDLLHREEVPKLTEEWLEATERRLDIELALGRHRRLPSELRPLTAAYPDRERFREQLVEALYRSGRQAEALEECRKIRRILLDELGIDPGPDLQRLEVKILRGEALPNRLAGATGQSARAASTSDSVSASCQLPLEIPDFVDRVDIATAMVEDLTHGGGRAGPAVAILRGGPGVGKTALALRVAHQLRPVFPDGQWYVRLVDPGGSPRACGDVLGDLLRAAGVDVRDLPVDLVARASALRASMTDRRVLLVLDDVASVEQAQPLLPGTPGNAVLAISRMSLIGFTALCGVRRYHLDVLPPPDAVELLARMVGRDVVHNEYGAATELAALCGYLPLALRIVAAKLVDRPNPDLSGYVRWLRTDTLAKLAIGPSSPISVRKAFETSYRALDGGAQRLFRLLGRIGPDISADEVAARIGGPPGSAEQVLDELLDAGMIRNASAGRFAMRGLMYLYAQETARETAEHRT
jgi:DNA-binding SARP family transcriptional activator